MSTQTAIPSPAAGARKALIIGLAGKARHDKDTVADYLVQHHGFVRLAYTDAIRDM